MRPVIAVAVLTAAGLALASCAPKTTKSTPPPGATVDTSRNALDWAGTYAGVVPCADCEGIETSITLGMDSSYLVRTKYLGKSAEVFERRGSFTWNEAGNIIQLQGMSGGPAHYLVGENALIQLDQQASRIAGDLATQYILPKSKAPAALPPPGFSAPSSWRLTEIMGKPVVPPAEGKQVPSIIFVKESPRVSGFAGCNRFTGLVEFSPGDRLRFSKVAATMMACPDMTLEGEFLKVLETTDNYFQDGDKLVLHRARMAPLARFEAVRDPEP